MERADPCRAEEAAGLADYRARALALLSTDQKIAEPDQILGKRSSISGRTSSIRAGSGACRRSRLIAAGQPQWRTLLDIDAMSKADNKKWVFKGATCLSPAYADCMVSLSNGGGDAVEIREFDLDKAAFVAGGFTLSERQDRRRLGRAGCAVRRHRLRRRARSPIPAMPGSSSCGTAERRSRRRQAIAEGVKTRRVGQRVDRVDGDQHLADRQSRRSISIITRSATSRPTGAWCPRRFPTMRISSDVLDGRVIASLKTPWQGHPAGALVAYFDP